MEWINELWLGLDLGDKAFFGNCGKWGLAEDFMVRTSGEQRIGHGKIGKTSGPNGQSPRASPQRPTRRSIWVAGCGLPFQALQAKDLCTKMIEVPGLVSAAGEWLWKCTKRMRCPVELTLFGFVTVSLGDILNLKQPQTCFFFPFFFKKDFG